MLRQDGAQHPGPCLLVALMLVCTDSGLGCQLNDAANPKHFHLKLYLVVHKQCCFTVMQLYGTRADLQVQFTCWQLSNQASCGFTGMKLHKTGWLDLNLGLIVNQHCSIACRTRQHLLLDFHVHSSRQETAVLQVLTAELAST